jgi:hypothetical protein
MADPSQASSLRARNTLWGKMDHRSSYWQILVNSENTKAWHQ